MSHPHLSTSFISVLDTAPASKAEQIINGVLSADTMKGHADFAAVCAVAQHVEYQKTQTYGQSWKKRGELFSVYPNLARKWDRIENLMDRMANNIPLPQDETLVDTVFDLGVYCLKWVAEMAETRPEQFHQFVEAAAKLNNA
jgi:hypothetical protein